MQKMYLTNLKIWKITKSSRMFANLKNKAQTDASSARRLLQLRMEVKLWKTSGVDKQKASGFLRTDKDGSDELLSTSLSVFVKKPAVSFQSYS